MKIQNVLIRYRKRLNNRLETIKDFVESGNVEMMKAADTLQKDKEELEIIVESLEERIGRLSGCYYCHGEYEEWRKGWTVSIPSSADANEEVVTINFCPMCGRNLTT
jgi:hypothetical protein